jgi:hypothetical protein
MAAAGPENQEPRPRPTTGGSWRIRRRRYQVVISGWSFGASALPFSAGKAGRADEAERPALKTEFAATFHAIVDQHAFFPRVSLESSA